MSRRILYYIHAKTGEKYPHPEYVNHGHGGIHRGAKDLPKDGYPYRTIVGRP